MYSIFFVKRNSIIKIRYIIKINKTITLKENSIELILKIILLRTVADVGPDPTIFVKF